MTIYSDSQSAICLVKSPTFHAKTKHIDVKYHFVRDMVEDDKVKLEKVENLVNVADAITKPVTIEKFRWCTEYMTTTHACKEAIQLKRLGSDIEFK